MKNIVIIGAGLSGIYAATLLQKNYPADHKAMSSHPNYGYDEQAYDNRLLFTGTESAFQEGGYLEGCIVAASNIVKTIKSL